MTSLVQIVAVAVSTCLLAVVLELVRRRKLSEEYSLIWITCAVGLLVLALRRGLLDSVAIWLDIQYGPAVLLLVLILFVFVTSLYFSVIVSTQRTQIERLAEAHALLENRLTEAVKSPPRGSGPAERSATEAPTRG